MSDIDELAKWRSGALIFQDHAELIKFANDEIKRLEAKIERLETLPTVNPTYCQNCGAVNLKGDSDPTHSRP
jgi:hypothetical protein